MQRHNIYWLPDTINLWLVSSSLIWSENVRSTSINRLLWFIVMICKLKYSKCTVILKQFLDAFISSCITHKCSQAHVEIAYERLSFSRMHSSYPIRTISPVTNLFTGGCWGFHNFSFVAADLMCLKQDATRTSTYKKNWVYVRKH